MSSDGGTPDTPPARVYLDLTHVGRHVTGIERVAIEQFEKVAFDGAEIRQVKARSVPAMILKQQLLLPLLALLHPRAKFVFPGLPPSPLFALLPERVVLYVHDTFLLTRRTDLSGKARLYMAPQFAFAVRRLKRFFVNSEKTAADLKPYVRCDADIRLYRPTVANHFSLDAAVQRRKPVTPSPLKLVSLGTIEPRKNYEASVAILDAIRATLDPAAVLHIVGRIGWGDSAKRIAAHVGVITHGYLAAADVKRVLEAADIYLCTSHDEGLGLPLLEAQFAGLPVVAPDQDIFREVLGTSGTYIDPSRPADVAKIIGALIAGPEWREQQAAAATKNVRHWNAIANDDLAAARSAFASETLSRDAAPSSAPRRT